MNLGANYLTYLCAVGGAHSGKIFGVDLCQPQSQSPESLRLPA